MTESIIERKKEGNSPYSGVDIGITDYYISGGPGSIAESIRIEEDRMDTINRSLAKAAESVQQPDHSEEGTVVDLDSRRKEKSPEVGRVALAV